MNVIRPGNAPAGLLGWYAGDWLMQQVQKANAKAEAEAQAAQAAAELEQALHDLLRVVDWIATLKRILPIAGPIDTWVMPPEFADALAAQLLALFPAEFHAWERQVSDPGYHAAIVLP
jgi:hypothetical protein